MSTTRSIPCTLGSGLLLVLGFVASLRATGGGLTPLVDVGSAVEPVLVLEAFDKEAGGRWKLDHSENTVCAAEFGHAADGIAGPVLKLDCAPNGDSKTKEPRWFSLTSSSVATETSREGADGLRLVIAVAKRARWWLSLGLVSEGKTYRLVALPDLLSRDGVFEDRLLPFARFKSKDGSVFQGGAASEIEISGSAPKNTLYIDRVELYRKVKLDTWLTFKTTREESNLFERGESVGMRFRLGGEKPQDSTAFTYVVRDYHENIALEGSFSLSNETPEYATTFNGAPGFYEVRAFRTGGGTGDRSCIKTTGSLPQGLGTFAIMPSTLAENVERRKRVGGEAFFGFHGHANGLTDYMGVSWDFGGGRWIWKEKDARPDRGDGMANWAREEIAKFSPQPDYEIHHIINLGANHIGAVPKWARKESTDEAPPFTNWEDFLNFWRDTIRVNKAVYPHMKPRTYDPAWEINLNVPKTGVHKPPFHPEDVVELYRRTREVLKEEDPDAILVGPNCSSPIKHLEWNEPLFKAGLLDYIDAYNCHGYHSPPPEEARVVEGFRNLRAMIRKYNNGRDLPIFITELGYRSRYGSDDRYREHARWHTRVAIILKGEGVKAYLPFYGYDFPGKEASWGFCFNLEPTEKWGPRWVSPRPASPALAVCVRELEGAAPVRDLRFFGSGVWGYVFRSDAGPVLTLWHPEYQQRLRLPVGDVSVVRVTDIMGKTEELTPCDGTVSLDLGPSPVYVHGASYRLYGTAPATLAALDGTDVLQILPGETREVVLLQGLQPQLESVRVLGPAEVDITADNGLTARVTPPTDLGPDPIPVLITYRGHAEKRRDLLFWIVRQRAIQLESFDLQVRDGSPAAAITLSNSGKRMVEAQAKLVVNGAAIPTVELKLQPSARTDAVIPLPIDGPVDPTKRHRLELTVACANANDVRSQKSVNLLAAHRCGGDLAHTLPNRVNVQGTGASGRLDDTEVQLHWDTDALLLDVIVHDDIHTQRLNDGTVWREDSLQIAFDTHPEQDALYEPLTSVFTKKITEIAIARTPNGALAWRHRTHNEGELPTGAITSAITPEIKRNDAEQTTVYHLRVPWKEIGLGQVSAGKPVGISLLVNDLDGDNSKRAGIELFGGIMHTKNHKEFGVFVLR